MSWCKAQGTGLESRGILHTGGLSSPGAEAPPRGMAGDREGSGPSSREGETLCSYVIFYTLGIITKYHSVKRLDDPTPDAADK